MTKAHDGPRIDTAAEIAYRHMTHFLRGVNPDLAHQWTATIESYREQSQAKTFTAAVAGLLAAAQPDQDTSKAMTHARAAATAFAALRPHMHAGLAVATWTDAEGVPYRVVIAVDGLLKVDDVMTALRPLTGKGG